MSTDNNNSKLKALIKLALALSILVATITYSVYTIKKIQYQDNYHHQSLACASQNNNFQSSYAYMTCMIYHGYDDRLSVQ